MSSFGFGGTSSPFGASGGVGGAFQQQPASGSLFGSANANKQSSGSMFGNSGSQNTGGLFGSSGTSQLQQNANSGGGLFGGSTGQQQLGSTQTGSLFGQTNTPQTSASGGLFGQTNTSQTPASGGLFGQTNTSQAPASGGLFGQTNTAQTPASGGLFGQTNTTQTATSGGLFGQSNTSQTATPGGLFGSAAQQTGANSSIFGTSTSQTQAGGTSTGLFGSLGQQNQGSSLFGSTQQQPQTTTGLFGSTMQQSNAVGGVFGTSGMTQNASIQQQPVSIPWWYRELLNIQTAYRQCAGSRFQTMLYEVVGYAPDLLLHSGSMGMASVENYKTNRKRMVLQSNPWIDEREWLRADENNPDPVNWMPSPIVGIDSLHERMNAQATHIRAQLDMISGGFWNNSSSADGATTSNGSQSLQDGGTKANADQASGDVEYPGTEGLTGNQWLSFSANLPSEKIESCRHEHVRLKHRLVKALGRLERLQSAALGGHRSAAEIEFDQRLSRLVAILNHPQGCRAQLSSIVSQVELEDLECHQGSQTNKLSMRNYNRSAVSELSKQDQRAIFNFLELQRDGIDNLMKIVKKDMRDLEIIKRRTQAEEMYGSDLAITSR